MAESRSAKEVRQEREKMLVLKHKLDHRITTTRIAKAALDEGNYAVALQKFSEYMDTMAEAKKVSDFFSLKPGNFDPKKDVTEMLMISHIYFEMARIYDAVPKYKENSQKCLEQFVIFSVNQPFQVVNSELIRKHLKKSLFKNPEAFHSAYNQIYVQSKKCYVVTFCYGNDHEITQDFRKFKDWLLGFRLGQEFVRVYYLFSSKTVPHWEGNRVIHLLSGIFLRPTLALFSKTILRFILPKC